MLALNPKAWKNQSQCKKLASIMTIAVYASPTENVNSLLKTRLVGSEEHHSG
jgi:hypothetical protein